MLGKTLPWPLHTHEAPIHNLPPKLSPHCLSDDILEVPLAFTDPHRGNFSMPDRHLNYPPAAHMNMPYISRPPNT